MHIPTVICNKARNLVAELLETKMFQNPVSMDNSYMENIYLYFWPTEKNNITFGLVICKKTADYKFVYKVCDWDLNSDFEMLMEHLDEKTSNELLFHLNLL